MCMPLSESGVSYGVIDSTTLHQCALYCHEWWLLVALQNRLHYVGMVHCTTQSSVNNIMILFSVITTEIYCTLHIHSHTDK